MHNHWLFVGNVAVHWVAAMSGAVAFVLSIFEYVRDKKMEAWVFFAASLLFFFVACDLAWQDEHRNSQILVGEKASLASQEEFWKEQSYAKDATLRTRDELLAKNYSALIGEQSTANRTQASLTELSGKILDIGKPLKLKWDSLALESAEQVSINPPILRSRWILLTNKLVSPAEFTFGCSLPIESAEVKVAGNAGVGRVVHLDKDEWGAKVMSPAWSPDAPILVITNFSRRVTPESISCRFHLNSSAD